MSRIVEIIAKRFLVGALIMVGFLTAFLGLVWFLVLRFDPEARGPRTSADAEVGEGR